MKTYNVTIEACVRKTITVTAENEDDAGDEAFELFSVVHDEYPESYNEDIISIEETLT